MNNSIRELLCEEQNKIIDSRCKYIIVSACPGSGKTYTLVKKIKKELLFSIKKLVNVYRYRSCIPNMLPSNQLA